MLKAFFFSFRSECYILVTQCTDIGSLPDAAFSDLIDHFGGDVSDYTFVEVKDWNLFEFYLRDGTFSLVDADVRPFIIIPVTLSSL